MSINEQQKFREKYVDSNEIIDRLDIYKSALSQAIAKGTFPPPDITVGRSTLWVRVEIEPYIEAWRQRRANA